MVRGRCSAKRLKNAMDRLPPEKKDVVTEYGFGGLFELACTQVNMPLCLWMMSKINVAYCNIELEGGSIIPITCNHVGEVFGLPCTGRTMELETGRNRGGGIVPNIDQIEQLMLDTEDMMQFRRLFIIFACATFVAPTARLEGQHALWHAPAEAYEGEVNWSQFLLDALIRAIHDHRRLGGSYIRGCLMFLQLWYVSLSHFPPMTMPTSAPRCAHWTDALIKKRLKVEVQMLGQLGRVQFKFETVHNEGQNDNAPTNEGPPTETCVETLEVVVAWIDARKAEIEGAHRHVSSLLALYAHDVETLKRFIPSSSGDNANIPPTNATDAPAEGSVEVGSKEGSHGGIFKTGPGLATGGESDRRHSHDDHGQGSPHGNEGEVGADTVEPIQGEPEVSSVPPGSGDHNADGSPTTTEPAINLLPRVEGGEPTEEHESPPLPNEDDCPLSVLIEKGGRKRRTKATAGRLRNRARACKSPFVNYCISKCSRLSNQETTIADYVFDESREATEVLCLYGGDGITRADMNCLCGDGPLGTPVVRIVCSYLNALEGDRGVRHFMMPAFGEVACAMSVNTQKKNVRTKLGKFTKGLDSYKQYFIPVFAFNQWVVVGLNLEAKRIEILSSAPNNETANFTGQARKMAIFMNTLLPKAFKHNHVELKAFEPHVVDIPGHSRQEDCGLYAVLYMLNWDGSGLRRALDAFTPDRLALERLRLAVVLIEAEQNELKASIFDKILSGQGGT